MNRPSTRSRFNAPEPPAQRPKFDDEDDRRVKPGTIAGQVFLVMFIGIVGYMAWDWQIHDISGEYQTYTKQVGLVDLSLVRKATSVSGELILKDGAPLTMTDGKLIGEDHVQMSFATPQ